MSGAHGEQKNCGQPAMEHGARSRPRTAGVVHGYSDRELRTAGGRRCSPNRRASAWPSSGFWRRFRRRHRVRRGRLPLGAMVVFCSPRLPSLLHQQMLLHLYDLLHRLLVVELWSLTLVLEPLRPCLLDQGCLLVPCIGLVPPRFANGWPHLCQLAHPGSYDHTCRVSLPWLRAVHLGGRPRRWDCFRAPLATPRRHLPAPVRRNSPPSPSPPYPTFGRLPVQCAVVTLGLCLSASLGVPPHMPRRHHRHHPHC